ncbi:MAG: type II secretion system secretin GspD, partial [Sulfuritalea sp.]|nr:type II secretion system secretin GspD [Sulfuritalea sp.]
VDPRVKGTLQVTAPQPVTPQMAYEIILTSLRMQGYAAVEVDDVVLILPEADAKFYAAPVASKGKGKVSGKTETRVFALKNEPAAQMLQTLRPLVGPTSAMNADAGSNTLVVTDYSTNLDRLARIIDHLDGPGADEPVLIPVKHAAAEEVAALIRRVYKGETNGVGSPGSSVPEINRLDMAVDTRSNSLILRSRNRNLISRVVSMVASVDTRTPAAGNVNIIYLRNAEATKVAETLRRILAGDGSSSQPAASSPSQTTAALGGGRPAAAQAPAADQGPSMIQADAASNALIITAPEAVFNNLKAVVEKLDVRRAQVLVEALIVELSAEKATEFGIQWFDASGTPKNNGDPKFFGGFANSGGPSNLATVAANPQNAVKGLSLGLVNGTLTLPGVGTVLNLGVLARALETNADVNILSTPTLMTLDNEEAKISVGSNVPFSTGQYNVTGTAVPFETIERRDVGLTLRVKPQISEGGTVRLQIYQEVSKLRQGAEGDTKATTDKRSIESMVLVDDGQILVLGGLIEDTLQEVQDKIPLLGDIPGLGNFFRYNTRRHGKTNLMVFLRPLVVRDSKAAANVTHPRYDHIRNTQNAASTSGDKPLVPEVDAAMRPLVARPLNTMGPGTPAAVK